MLSANSGFLLAFIAGHYCSYQTIPITWVGIPIIFLCIFQMFPETPIYLLKHNKAEVSGTQESRFDSLFIY